MERRKAAVAEIRKKIKEEQIRVREEVSVKYTRVQSLNLLVSLSQKSSSVYLFFFQRHKEYIKMLKERTEALGEVKT